MEELFKMSVFCENAMIVSDNQSLIPAETGVYCFCSKIDGKIYIGGSASKPRGIRGRFTSHLSAIKRGDRKNYLYRAIRKHGLNNYNFLILEFTDDVWTREQYYIDKYKPWKRNIGYNFAKIVDAPPDMTGIPNEALAKPYKFKKDGVIYEGDNISQFCRDNNLPSGSMSSVIGGKCRFYKGWSLPETEGEYRPHRPIYEFRSSTGEIVKIDDLHSFCKNKNLSVNCMRLVANKIQYRHKGWTNPEVELDPQRTYIFISPEGVENKADNLRDFCKKHNLPESSIYSLAASRTKDYQGWKVPKDLYNPDEIEWYCESCGNKQVTKKSGYQKKKTKTCRSCSLQNSTALKREDLTGRKFGMLTVIELNGQNKEGRYQWLCKCDCGGEKNVAGKNLKNGNTASCGCLSKENRSKFKTRYDKRGERKDMSNKKSVIQIDKNTGEIINTYKTIADASKETGTYRNGISRCLNGQFKTANGFVWKEGK